jgi:hypothetical protein
MSFFCLSLSLFLFGNFIISTFHCHNKWEECPTCVGGAGGIKIKSKLARQLQLINMEHNIHLCMTNC